MRDKPGKRIRVNDPDVPRSATPKREQDSTTDTLSPDRSSHVVVMEQVTLRKRTSVEVERMTKGPPKVTVRVDDDDPDIARKQALMTYARTIQDLEEADLTD